MPGFDGTGPRGMGSMTGGGRGFGFRGITGYPASRPWVRQGIPYGYTHPEAGSFAPQG